jgi:plastocyanin
MKKGQEEVESPNRNLTVVIARFLSIAGLLILAAVLPSTLINNIHIGMKMTFAQQAEEEEEKHSVEKQGIAQAINRKPTEIISAVKTLLNQTLNEYRNQNFAGAQSIATSAYLDNFEFIEAPLEKHDKALKENTEIMLREQLRQSIKDKLSIESIQQLVSKINSNLNKAEQLLTQTDSSIKPTAAVNSSVAQTLLPPSSSISALNTTNKVLIAGDESDQPYMPSSITIKTGDKVGWINTDEEAHTVTSGFENSTEKAKQFDSGLLNVNQTFEHTFDKAGVFNYFCTVHPTMTGVVNVK